WRRASRPSDSRTDAWWDAHAAKEPPPDEIVARKDLQQAVYASVDALEPDLRDTIHLHYYQELTLQETADAMEVALSTVKYRQQQALNKLQKKLTSPEPSLKRTTTTM